MPTPSPELIEIASRHQAQYERLKSHEVKSFDNFLKLLDEDLRKQLSRSDLTLFTRSRLEKQLALIREIIRGIYDDYEKTWRDSMIEAAKYEAEFEKTALDRVVINHEFVLPTETQISAAVFARPLSVEGINNGALLDQFFRGLPDSTIKRVEGAIRLGFAQGQTTQQVINRIRGTAKARYTDGLMALSKRDADIITRTALQHVSSQSRQATWERNSDIIKGVRWVSTLDSRTSQTCRSLSGRIFPMDKGPRPPIHINCLSGDTDILSRSRIANIYKRHYEGAIIKIRTKSGRTLTITPNHPILTRAGWKAAGNINRFDELATISNPSFIENNEEYCVKSKFSDLFAAAYVTADASSVAERPSSPEYFHGDGSNTNVSIVNIDRLGWDGFREAVRRQYIVNSSIIKRASIRPPLFRFRGPNHFFLARFSTPGSFMSVFGKFSNLLRSRISHARELLFAPISKFYSFIGEKFLNWSWAHSKFFCYPSNAYSIFKHRDNQADVNFRNRFLMFARNFKTNFLRVPIKNVSCYSKLIDCVNGIPSFRNKINGLGASIISFFSVFRNFISSNPYLPEPGIKSGFCDSGNLGALFNGVAGQVEFDSVVECINVYFSGHVYNLENQEHWYLSNGIITHNCRSTVVSVLDDRFKVLDEGATQAARNESGKVVKVDAEETYYSWLKKQSANFQDSIIGKTRGKLLRDGGLSAERFAEINLNRDFSPATLDEMREMDILAFERAGL